MKLKEQQPVEIVAILDRSGSMATIHDDSIGGFNSFLKDQQELDGAANLSVVLFDDQYEVLYDDVDVKKAKELDKKSYSLRGMTAMNDAIGKTLTKMFSENPEKAIIVILTDGQENSSKEFTTPQVKALIEKAQGKGWQVTFLAANQDAFATGVTYGIDLRNVANFKADSKGTMDAYATMSVASTNYRNNNQGN